MEVFETEKLATFTPPELDENAMATQKEMGKIHANNAIKREELLEANLDAGNNGEAW